MNELSERILSSLGGVKLTKDNEKSYLDKFCNDPSWEFKNLTDDYLEELALLLCKHRSTRKHVCNFLKDKALKNNVFAQKLVVFCLREYFIKDVSLILYCLNYRFDVGNKADDVEELTREIDLMFEKIEEPDQDEEEINKKYYYADYFNSWVEEGLSLENVDRLLGVTFSCFDLINQDDPDRYHHYYYECEDCNLNEQTILYGLIISLFFEKKRKLAEEVFVKHFIKDGCLIRNISNPTMFILLDDFTKLYGNAGCFEVPALWFEALFYLRVFLKRYYSVGMDIIKTILKKDPEWKFSGLMLDIVHFAVVDLASTKYKNKKDKESAYQLIEKIEHSFI